MKTRILREAVPAGDHDILTKCIKVVGTTYYQARMISIKMSLVVFVCAAVTESWRTCPAERRHVHGGPQANDEVVLDDEAA